jgi:hypothetical protein
LRFLGVKVRVTGTQGEATMRLVAFWVLAMGGFCVLGCGKQPETYVQLTVVEDGVVIRMLPDGTLTSWEVGERPDDGAFHHGKEATSVFALAEKVSVQVPARTYYLSDSTHEPCRLVVQLQGKRWDYVISSKKNAGPAAPKDLVDLVIKISGQLPW